MGYRIPTKKSKYYLPKHEYLQVKHFALRYQDLQNERIELLLSGAKAINYDGMPHGSSVTDPVESAGMKLALIDRQISLIEDTAAEIGGELYKWLLKGVTEENITYIVLRNRYGMPCYRDLYYTMRQKFYHRLSLKLAFL